MMVINGYILKYSGVVVFILHEVFHHKSKHNKMINMINIPLKMHTYKNYFILLLLFSWPPVREVCPNYEVVMFQTQKGTPPDLGSVTNCYIDMLLIPATPFPPATQCPTGGATLSCPLPL